MWRLNVEFLVTLDAQQEEGLMTRVASSTDAGRTWLAEHPA
jgi:hypothetical protein